MQPDMESTYDSQAEAFYRKSDQLISWQWCGRRILDRHISVYPSSTILDQGCASGRLISYFTDRGVSESNIHGIEISGKQADIARARFPESTVTHGDISQVEVPLKSYNVVVSHMVYEFLNPDGLDAALGFAYEGLKRDGTMMLVVTHPEKMTASNGISEPGWFELDAPWGGKINNWFRTKKDYINAFESRGFKIEAVEDCYIHPFAAIDDKEKYEQYRAHGTPLRLAIKAWK